MYLQEHIKRILREEIQMPLVLRRRLQYVDDKVEMSIRTTYTPNYICRFASGDELLDVITETSIDSMYFNHFNSVDDSSRDWVNIYVHIEKYIKKKYGDKIREYYHINCGN
jgi:hypothetical protein